MELWVMTVMRVRKVISKKKLVSQIHSLTYGVTKKKKKINLI